MSTWIKLHSSLTESSVWEEPYHVRIVWTAMMAKCKLNGVLEASESAIHRMANVTLEEAEDALRVLSSPDPKSKSQEFDGRRIERVNGGYRLLNYFNYRESKSPDEKAKYMREYMRKRRAEKKEKMGWKESRRIEADAAMLKQIPLEFPAEVEDGLNAFLRYRYGLATKSARVHDSVRLTEEMVDALFDATRSALVSRDPVLIADKLNSAALAGYRSPNFQALYD